MGVAASQALWDHLVGTGYIDARNFTEPLFVIAIMVVAGSKPVLHVAKLAVTGIATVVPLPRTVALYWLILVLVPLLGSFITEPAAMTLAAFMLRDRFYKARMSSRLMYATIGVLFVNVSIGGVLTPYAAPAPGALDLRALAAAAMLALAVHAKVPTTTLRSMVFAYPTFHRAVSTALADLEQ